LRQNVTLNDKRDSRHTAYRGVEKTPYIIGTLLSLAPIAGKTLPLPNKDVDSATRKNTDFH